MESTGKGGEVGGFDVFRQGGLADLLGVGNFGGFDDLLGEAYMEQKVMAEGCEAVVSDGFFSRCGSGYPVAPPFSSSPTPSSYRMMSFAGEEGFPVERKDGLPYHKSGACVNDSCSSTSSSSGGSTLSKLKRMAAETEGFTAERLSSNAVASVTKKSTAKKPKKEPHRTLKVRKENLGDRVSALQQLVSPFGKSDTASVLHEALGYIRFLHNQVQVLSSPYLQRLPSSSHLLADGTPPRRDLRSRGLCLVPVACTANVAGSNGADFWSPSVEGGVDDDHPLDITEH